MNARHAAAALTLAASLSPAMALDFAKLWDFGDPAASEQRFRAALAGATPDEQIVLQTQIARTHGLRRDFAAARRILDELAPRLAGASPQARARHALELGRTLSSAAHDPASQTEAARAQARAAYLQAHDIARAGGLDELAVDALHMMAFVDTAPADRLRWGEQALALALRSTQPAARAWQASLRNNLGMALHDLGRHEEALAQFEQALALRERDGSVPRIRVARWMVAWALRTLGRHERALELQLQLEREWDADGRPDPYVFEELEALYRARGDDERARHYAARRQAAMK